MPEESPAAQRRQVLQGPLRLRLQLLLLRRKGRPDA